MIITRTRDASGDKETISRLSRSLEEARAQTSRLERLIHLEARAREASGRRALGFVMMNDTLAVLSYRQAALWWRPADGEGEGTLEGVSGVTDTLPHAAFPVWLRGYLARFADSRPQKSGEKPDVTVSELTVDEASLTAHDRQMLADYLPKYGLWAELKLAPPPGSSKSIRAALVLWRDMPWTEPDKALLKLICGAYSDAWGALDAGRLDWRGEKTLSGGFSRVVGLSRRKAVRWGLAAAVLLALLFPVRQSVLAPAEVVPENPLVVRAPLEGVVAEVAVAPNSPVKKGDLLLRMDARDLRKQLQGARQALAVASAQLRQAEQESFFDEKSKMSVAVLRSRRDEAQSDVQFLEGEFARTEVRAPADGIAVFSDAGEWSGRPVAVGERIMTVADPARVVLEAQIPAADAVELPRAAQVRFFLNAEPVNPADATLTSLAYRAEPTPEGTLAYRARAAFEKPEARLRIGLRGTAKFYGERTALGLYLFRKPLSVLRRWLGL